MQLFNCDLRDVRPRVTATLTGKTGICNRRNRKRPDGVNAKKLAPVLSASLPYAERRRMVTAPAFIRNRAAANATADLALDLSDSGGEKELKTDVVPWVK